MVSRFVRKVRTASGAVAVQVVTKAHGEIVELEHVGSARTDADLALLLRAARERLHRGQGELDFGPAAGGQGDRRRCGGLDAGTGG